MWLGNCRLIVLLSTLLICIVALILFLNGRSFPTKVSVVKVFSTKLFSHLDQSIPFTEILDGPLPQEHPLLIDLIRSKIQPPSTLPYNDSQNLASLLPLIVTNLEKFFANKKEKYYLEVGAFDGEFHSHTYHLERDHGWTGFLIEAEPGIHARLMAKHRKSSTLHACLSNYIYPMKVTFYEYGMSGYIDENKVNGPNNTRYSRVQCFPIYSILMALNRTTIDYFVLDVESSTPLVIHQIPFEKYDIRTISIEYIFFKGGKEELKAIMTKKGYTAVMDYPPGYDWFFVRNDLVAEYNKTVNPK